MRQPAEGTLLVNALLREGSIVELDTDREGGPFYALAGYVEPGDRLDNSDLVLGRDYSGRYDTPIWRDDAYDGAHLSGDGLPCALVQDRRLRLGISQLSAWQRASIPPSRLQRARRNRDHQP